MLPGEQPWYFYPQVSYLYYPDSGYYKTEEVVRVEKKPRVEVYHLSPTPLTSTNEWRWRLRAGNGEIVCSGEAHSNERDAKRAAMTVAGIFYDAPDVVTVES